MWLKKKTSAESLERALKEQQQQQQQEHQGTDQSNQPPDYQEDEIDLNIEIDDSEQRIDEPSIQQTDRSDNQQDNSKPPSAGSSPQVIKPKIFRPFSSDIQDSVTLKQSPTQPRPLYSAVASYLPGQSNTSAFSKQSPSSTITSGQYVSPQLSAFGQSPNTSPYSKQPPSSTITSGQYVSPQLSAFGQSPNTSPYSKQSPSSTITSGQYVSQQLSAFGQSPNTSLYSKQPPSSTITSGEYNLQQLQESQLQAYQKQQLEFQLYNQEVLRQQQEYHKYQEEHFKKQQQQKLQQQQFQQQQHLQQQHLQQQQLQQQQLQKQQQLQQQQQIDHCFKAPYPPDFNPTIQTSSSSVSSSLIDEQERFYLAGLESIQKQRIALQKQRGSQTAEQLQPDESQINQYKKLLEQLQLLQQRLQQGLETQSCEQNISALLSDTDKQLNSSIERQFRESINFDKSPGQQKKTDSKTKTTTKEKSPKNPFAPSDIVNRIYENQFTDKEYLESPNKANIITIRSKEDIMTTYGVQTPAVKPILNIAIIGGTGLEKDFDIFSQKETVELPTTPFGEPSQKKILKGTIGKSTVYLMSRHGDAHTINPSDVNYQANIYALKELGVHAILASTACGSLKREIAPGHLVVLDQYIDRTKGNRKGTFYKVAHIPQEEPFDANFRKFLIESCEELKYAHSKTGTAVTIEGPRFSTKAESKLYQSYGADIVNMTTVPEAQLAAEKAMHYAALALVTDYDCWHEDPEQTVTVKLVNERLKSLREKAKEVFIRTIQKSEDFDWTSPHLRRKRITKESIMTQ